MNKNFSLITILLLVFLIDISKIFAKKSDFSEFVTIKFDEVNARTGPESDCPIEWVFVKKGEPVKIIAHYEQWRKIHDIHGEGGWVHVSALSKKKSVIVKTNNPVPLLDSIGKYDRVLARLSPDLRCGLSKCKKEWCYVNCKSYKGWVEKKFLWGLNDE